MTPKMIPSALFVVMAMVISCPWTYAEDMAEVELLNGKTYALNNTQLKHIYSTGQYVETQQNDFYSHTVTDNHICLIQGWLWEHMPVAQIKSMKRLSHEEIFQDKAHRRGRLNQSLNASLPLFRVTFKDGSQMYANVEGELSGQVTLGILHGEYTGRFYDMQRLDMVMDEQTQTVHITIEHSDGRRQDHVTHIKSRFKKWDRLKYFVTERPQVIVDFPGDKAGIILEVDPEYYQGRTLTLNRHAKEGLFNIVGMLDTPVEARFAKMNLKRELEPTYLKFFLAKTVVDGHPAYVAVELNEIQSLSLQADEMHAIRGEVKIKQLTDTIDLTGLTEMSYWYDDVINKFKFIEKQKVIRLQVLDDAVDIPFDEIVSLVTTDSDQTTVTLKAGETHTGQIQHDDYFIEFLEANLKYSNFPAKGTFPLKHLRSFRRVGREE